VTKSFGKMYDFGFSGIRQSHALSYSRGIPKTLNPCPVPLKRIPDGACELLGRGAQRVEIKSCCSVSTAEANSRYKSWKFLVRELTRKVVRVLSLVRIQQTGLRLP
jgi:hypothetical protein